MVICMASLFSIIQMEKFLQSGFYRNGKKHGEWKDYNIEGNVVSSKAYNEESVVQ